MTLSPLQQTAIAVLLAALASTAIYEARQAAKARASALTFQDQRTLLTNQLQQLQRQLDQTARLNAALRQNKENLTRDNAELLHLRAEVARLRAQSQPPTSTTSLTSLAATEAAAQRWVNRVAKLKQRLEQTPAAAIPELSLLAEADWLAAVKDLPLETEAEYRAALSKLRQAAETKAGSLLSTALRDFTRANSGQLPSDLAQLQSYLNVSLDSAILGRWQIADQKTVPNVYVGNVIVTQKAPVDEVFDRRLVFSPDGGSGSADWLHVGQTIAPVLQAYRAANNGQRQTDYSQLLPFASTPEEIAAIQQLILKSSVPRNP